MMYLFLHYFSMICGLVVIVRLDSVCQGEWKPSKARWDDSHMVWSEIALVVLIVVNEGILSHDRDPAMC